MANLIWQAKGLRGHISTITLSPRGSVSFDLSLASYNDVKVWPTNLYIQNANNNGGINVKSQNGYIRGIAPLVNYRLDVSPNDILTITNNGQRPVSLLIADTQAAADTDISMLIGSSAPSVTPSDLLLHFDKSDYTNDGVTTYNITVPSINAFDALNNVKFGGASLALLTGGYVKFFNAGFFDISKDFTIDAWFKFNAPGGTNTAYSFFVAYPFTVSRYFWLYYSPTLSQIILYVNNISTAVPYSFSAGVYRHVAVTKQNNTWRVFINGQVIITYTSSFSQIFDALSFSEDATFWVGWVDEAHYVRGIAMYTDNFTPPTEPYF